MSGADVDNILVILARHTVQLESMRDSIKLIMNIIFASALFIITTLIGSTTYFLTEKNNDLKSLHHPNTQTSEEITPNGAKMLD